MSNITSEQSDFERQIEFDFLRATELAALNTLQWLGKGQKEKADEAACDAIRGMLDLVNICGEVVIGEGIKDEAPGLFKGEQVGSWKAGSPRFEIALDPVDGTTNASKGMPNSLSCIVAAQSENGESCLQDIPAFYMKKARLSSGRSSGVDGGSEPSHSRRCSDGRCDRCNRDS